MWLCKLGELHHLSYPNGAVSLNSLKGRYLTEKQLVALLDLITTLERMELM